MNQNVTASVLMKLCNAPVAFTYCNPGKNRVISEVSAFFKPFGLIF